MIIRKLFILTCFNLTKNVVIATLLRTSNIYTRVRLSVGTYKALFMISLLLFIGFKVAQAQKEKEEPKAKKMKKSIPSSTKLEIPRQNNPWMLIQEAENIKEKNATLALQKLEEALSISIQDGNQLNEAHCYRILGAINLQNHLYESAIRQSLKALDLFNAIKYTNQAVSKTRYQLAESYFAGNQLGSALETYQVYLLQLDDKMAVNESVKAHYRIAEIYTKQGKTDQAKITYENVLALEKKNKNEEGIAEATRRIGELYQAKGKNKRALEYYKEAQVIAEKSNNANSYSKINDNISEVLIEDKKYEEDIDLRKKSIEKSQETKNPEVETKENLALGNTYLQLQQAQTAIPYLRRSLELSNRLGKLEQKGEALKGLSEAYSQQKQYEKAMVTFKKYLAIKDTLINEKEREIKKIVSANISLAEQQKHIDLLEKDIELNQQTISSLSHEQAARDEKLARQRTLIYSLGIGLLLILAASYLVYQNARKRRIANQLLALKSLRSQMNPHFIFNALNSVNSFISKNDERSANKYLADFSKLMRMVMENSQHDFVPLSQEVNILELYLSLEHFRFTEKFSYTFNVDKQIDTDAYDVPPMLIQPYIENAIWHGLRYKEEKGQLDVTFQKNEDNSISVVIEDNGIGRKKSAELKTVNQKSTHSTGIKNTVNRISLINELYKKNIQITIQDAQPALADVGTKVVIKLPKKI